MQSLPKGGIIDEYYSLIKDAVCATKPKLKEYINSQINAKPVSDFGLEKII